MAGLQVPVYSSNWKQYVLVEVDYLDQPSFDAVQQLVHQGLQSGKQNYKTIADAFELAISLCPLANPADLWRHVVYPAYLREQGDQSWKRASGDAFEQVLVDLYQPRLAPSGLRIIRTPKNLAPMIIERFGLTGVIAPSKIDIAIQGLCDDGLWHTFGIIHAKTSIAERVQDDAPASRAIIDKGFVSILATLDVKAFPPPHGDGVNRGELGMGNAVGKVMPKRNYVEVTGDFTNLYSFNLRSPESPETTISGSRIKTLGLAEAQPDKLTQDIVNWWHDHRPSMCAQPTVLPEGAIRVQNNLF